MNTLQAELISTRSQLASVHQRRAFENEQAVRIQDRMAVIGAEKTMLVKAVALIDKTIEVISANGIGRIESTVTNGLKLVFPEADLAFKVIKKEGARGNSYALEVQQGDVHGPIVDTFGGSVVNLVSFCLRVMISKRFHLAKFLVVDESFNNVSSIHLPMVSRLLKTLASNGYTILAITHQPILASAADSVYRVVPGINGPPSLHKLDLSELAELREAA